MLLKDSFRTAVKSLRHAKMRSLLTMLGIVIGISSVIVLMSIGQSAQDFIIGQVQGIGSNLIFIIPGGSSNSKFSAPASSQGIVVNTLVQNDIDSLSREPSIDLSAPEVRGQAKVVYGDNDSTVTFDGATADLFAVRNFTMSNGYAFTKSDVDSFNRVAVIGPDLATTIFGELNPIGKTIRLKDITFRVVGVLSKGGLGVGGIDQGNIVIIPITIAQKQMLGINYFLMITCEADPAYNIDFVKGRITSVLEHNHGITDPNKDDFTIRTQADAISLLGNITSVLTLFLTAIAAISLIVGEIGIMNIISSMTERTKEIGLRKAVGATEADVLKQFLIESVFLLSSVAWREF